MTSPNHELRAIDIVLLAVAVSLPAFVSGGTVWILGYLGALTVVFVTWAALSRRVGPESLRSKNRLADKPERPLPDWTEVATYGVILAVVVLAGVIYAVVQSLVP